MRSMCVAAVVLVPSLAIAGPKPLPASQHAPPVILDEASLSLEIVSKSSEGYTYRAHVEMSGVKAGDRARLDWKQGGKVIATTKCALGFEDNYAAGTCDYTDKPLKAKGDITAELIYSDDADDKEYLVRTLKTKVYNAKGQWETWGIFADDTLASAWMYLGHAEDGDSTYRRPTLYLWFATGESLNDGKLRCTVDGKKIPDLAMSPQGGSDTEEIEFDHQPKKGDRLTYKWAKAKYLLDGIYWGKRETLKWDMKDKTPKDQVWSDNPGKWDCAMRHDGKVIRQVLFTVDKDGMVVQDEMQTGKNPIPTVAPTVVMVDVRLTKDSATWDKRIVPAALKKSMAYGLPWPDHPKVKTIHASFPPKSGMPDMK